MNKTGTQRLETHRLVLRPFLIGDAEDMFANWASDPEVTRFLTWPAHSSVEVTRTVLNSWIPRYEDGGFFNWAIELKETGRVIGNISVVRLDESARELLQPEELCTDRRCCDLSSVFQLRETVSLDLVIKRLRFLIHLHMARYERLLRQVKRLLLCHAVGYGVFLLYELIQIRISYDLLIIEAAHDCIP